MTLLALAALYLFGSLLMAGAAAAGRQRTPNPNRR